MQTDKTMNKTYCAKLNETGRSSGRRFWLTPPDLFNKLNSEFHFTFDACPFPAPEGVNLLTMPWGQVNFVNPPFSRKDGGEFGGPTAFVKKAISESGTGKKSVLLLPIPHYVALLLRAKAEIRTVGRVRWVEVSTGRQLDKGKGSEIGLFIL